jgi:hypothetical protein
VLHREHGNKRLPHKDEIKQIFLDAVGEPTSSPRRNRGRGIEWKVECGFQLHISVGSATP